MRVESSFYFKRNELFDIFKSEWGYLGVHPANKFISFSSNLLN